jgi:hypothetical protein
LQREGGDPKRLAYFREEASEQRQRPGNGTPHPLLMTLPEIGEKKMKYTDENGLPIETLIYIGPLTIIGNSK